MKLAFSCWRKAWFWYSCSMVSEISRWSTVRVKIYLPTYKKWVQADPTSDVWENSSPQTVIDSINQETYCINSFLIPDWQPSRILCISTSRQHTKCHYRDASREENGRNKTRSTRRWWGRRQWRGRSPSDSDWFLPPRRTPSRRFHQRAGLFGLPVGGYCEQVSQWLLSKFSSSQYWYGESSFTWACSKFSIRSRTNQKTPNLHRILHHLGDHISIANDIASYEKEKRRYETGRATSMINLVHVIAKVDRMEETAAKSMAYAWQLCTENEILKELEELKRRDEMSVEDWNFVDACLLAASGNLLTSVVFSRYGGEDARIAWHEAPLYSGSESVRLRRWTLLHQN